ncbi:Hint domain-containing protein [Roseomonas populi]|uniref:Hint domain-containing protein n=1 Tax=Roseomonas populi TaxID=3121582 RepID=A0ABT1X958_9PROT|nr:Hint domain-containing protein [Roseomonas pecuniae]MCR0984301.1 Hint domain-containing protein [Roseomonas pecuniae]
MATYPTAYFYPLLSNGGNSYTIAGVSAFPYLADDGDGNADSALDGSNIVLRDGQDPSIVVPGSWTYAGHYGTGWVGLSSNGDYALLTNDDIGISSTFTAEPGPFAVCYLRGTRIMTAQGEVPVEDLREGDLVVCRFGGLRPIRWLGHQSLRGPRARGQEPVRIAPGALGEAMPRRPLLVTAGHSVLVGETLVLAGSLVNGVTITREPRGREWDYVQIDLGPHDLVLAEGAWSESFADVGTLRARFDNAAEFRARFPNHVAPAEVQLCAPRPAEGPALEAALRTTAARAAAATAPGPLEGRVESAAAPCRVTGWAADTAHPDLPVELEILLDGEPIGTALAWRNRADLPGPRRSGKGFSFEGERFLSTAELRRLVVRRASDGTALAPLIPAPADSPGPLDGHLDLVASPCRLEGWARDLHHPARPVLLEAVLDGRVLGTFNAARHRHDLADALLGDVAFVFETGLTLSPKDAAAIRIHRVADGAALRCTEATRRSPHPAPT